MIEIYALRYVRIFLYVPMQTSVNQICRTHSCRKFLETWISILLSCPSSLNWVVYVWPSSCAVKSFLISSRQIFQAAFIFKKWAFQQVLHGLLWGPSFTGCICCISIAPFTQVGFAAAHTRAESVEGLPQFPHESVLGLYNGSTVV